MAMGIILLIILSTALIISTITDLKKREVPDWISFSLIITSLSLRLIYSLISKQWNFFIAGLIGFIVFFILANLLYYGKQWGGGDSKLLMGVGAAFATYPDFLLKYFSPNLNFNILAIFLTNLFLAGGIYGTIWSFVLIIRNKEKFKQEFKNILRTKRMILTIITSFLITIILTSFLLISKTSLILMIIPLIIIPFFILLIVSIKAAEKSCMYKTISINKLTEGDWVAESSIRKKYNISELGIENYQINKLKRDKIKRILIKEGIPFTISFSIALLITLIFGNILTYLY